MQRPNAVLLDFDETHQTIGRMMSRLFDDVPDLLATLAAARIPIGLVTNSSPVAQRDKLHTVGLESTSDPQPDREIRSLRELAQTLAADP